MQFKKTPLNQNEFCRFIEKNYKTKSMLESINHTQIFFDKLVNKKHNPNIRYLLSNLRMSICELG